MKKLVIISMAFAACFFSCTKVQPASQMPESGVKSDNLISFTAKTSDLVVDTKAVTETKQSTLEANGIYVHAVKGTMGSAETEIFPSTKFNWDSGNSWFAGGQYWPSEEPTGTDTYKFYASNMSITSASTGAYLSITDNSTDILSATLGNPGFETTNTLSFNHVFTRAYSIEVNAPMDQGETSSDPGYKVTNLKISLKPYKGGKFKMFDATWPDKTPATPTAENLIDHAAEFDKDSPVSHTPDIMMVPGSYTLTATYHLVKGAYAKDLTKTASLDFPAGKKVKITTTLPPETKLIVFKITVGDWEEKDETIAASSWSNPS